ncbi:hypothetical protein OUZ56_000250 [Daphnia magna]|uniref:Uncharacterized protein n=1 Tax=Daphnia magna TaxID=35525 RepID=A0ABQ9ZZ45_9CRUS|nr:hypothetical protein OUZ56_000250 [Daphnia magna]
MDVNVATCRRARESPSIEKNKTKKRIDSDLCPVAPIEGPIIQAEKNKNIYDAAIGIGVDKEHRDSLTAD